MSFLHDFGKGFEAPFKVIAKGATGIANAGASAVGGVFNAGISATTSIMSIPGQVMGQTLKAVGLSGSSFLWIAGGVVIVLVLLKSK